MMRHLPMHLESIDQHEVARENCFCVLHGRNHHQPAEWIPASFSLSLSLVLGDDAMITHCTSTESQSPMLR